MLLYFWALFFAPSPAKPLTPSIVCYIPALLEAVRLSSAPKYCSSFSCWFLLILSPFMSVQIPSNHRTINSFSLAILTYHFRQAVPHKIKAK